MIRFDNVHKTYKTGVDALRGVSFEIDDGEFVFVIGKSGSGKSTLLKCITCEETPTEGSVTIDGFDISSMSRALVPVLRRQIGMIYQDFRLIETKTVFENIAFAGEIVGVPDASLKQTVQLMLNIVGLKDKANAYPQELSGGEQQRVAIARAMVNNPRIIVADEPTGNLDPEISENIMALLQEINRNGSTVIVCTHDSNLVDRMKKRVIEISEGLIARDEEGSKYSNARASAQAAAAVAAAPVNTGISFGDDPAFDSDREYHDNYDDDGFSSNTEFYFGETPEKPKAAPAPAVQSMPASAPAQTVEAIAEESIPEEFISEEYVETAENVAETVEVAKEEPVIEAPKPSFLFGDDEPATPAEEAAPEQATTESDKTINDNWIEEVKLDDIDLDIQEDDD